MFSLLMPTLSAKGLIGHRCHGFDWFAQMGLFVYLVCCYYCFRMVVILRTSTFISLTCLCCDKKHPSSNKISSVFPVFHIFSLYLQHRSATTAVVRNDFNEKVLLKLSSKVKLRKLQNAIRNMLKYILL